MEIRNKKGSMNAIRMHTRGGPENLVYEICEIPAISYGEVLIRVYAASITPTELTWNSTFTDSAGELRLPIIPSFEISGIIASVHDGVRNLKVGDEVYCLLDFWHNGGASEYVVTSADNVALKPLSIDFTSAASLALSGLTAWQALFDYGKLSPGQTVLIHGAGGGVGSLAVQLAVWKGSKVIGTCSREKIPLVSKLGAGQVLDYNAVKFEDIVRDVDLVLDTVGGTTLKRSYQVLKIGGTIVTIVDDIEGEVAQSFGVNGISMMVKPDARELKEISLLVDSGKLKPVISAVYPLRSAIDAFKYGQSSHNSGKIVLKVIE